MAVFDRVQSEGKIIDLIHRLLDSLSEEDLITRAESYTAGAIGAISSTIILTDVPDEHSMDRDVLEALDLGDINGVDRDRREILDPIYGLDGAVDHTDTRVEIQRMMNDLFGDHAALVAPIQAQSTFLGLLGVIDEPSRTFSERDHKVIRSIADVTARILHRDRMFEARGALDGLTGLMDQTSLRRELRSALARSYRHKSGLSLVMFDIDHFKMVNDTSGHLSGDQVLRQIGAFLGSARRCSDIVARYGGEEFAWMLPNTDETGAFVAAERLRSQIADVPNGGWTPWPHQITASFGVASIEHLPDDATDTDLIAAADQALYRSKQDGRNRTTCSSDTSVETLGRP